MAAVVEFRVEGIEAAVARVEDWARQVRYAASRAVTETAIADVRPALQQQMDTSFDRPTPWIKKSIWVDPATKDDLVATVRPQYLGGKGVDPTNVLRPEVEGGPRRRKRAEVALARIGVLPPGMYLVPSAVTLADASKTDAYGNVKGSFIVQLLSYFQAFGEQGYRANMTAKQRAKLSGRGKWINGRFVAAGKTVVGTGPAAFRKGGVEYFVSRGRGTFGALPAEGRQGREQKLPAGIWQRSGLHGARLAPVFLFVRAPAYHERYPMGDVFVRSATAGFPRRMAAWLARAVASSRGSTLET